MKKRNIIVDKIKKLICLVFAVLFYILGLIGLMIPIIPQVPFFVIGTVFMVIGFKSFKLWIMDTKFYKEHIKPNVDSNRVLKFIFNKKD